MINKSQNNDRPPVYYPTPVTTSTSAVISMICGILGWLGFFGLGGILAIIFGHIAKNEIRNGRGMVTGNGMATAGLVLGYLNVILSVLSICLSVLVFAGAITLPVCVFFPAFLTGDPH